MTLVVSLRVPDGVILAADSLQTTQAVIQASLKDFKVKHPTTGEEIPVGDLNMPPIPISTSTSSYAQKLFSFKNKFGIATFGSAILNNRTIYNHIKNLESNTKDEDAETMSGVANLLKSYFMEQLTQQLALGGQQLEPKQVVMGFQIVGFETKADIYGHTIEVIIGQNPAINKIEGIGCTVSGDTEVCRKLWEIGQLNPARQTNYGSFSLKDAIDYVEFLINTTANFQRFSNMIPTVGGAVDIALITNYCDFKWIKYKELTKILEKNI